MDNTNNRGSVKLAAACILSLLMVPSAAFADSMKDSTKERSQKSADPTGEYAMIFTQFGATFSDGDANTGDPKMAGSVAFQPIIPVPLYGKAGDQWSIVSRPTIVFFGEQPIPQEKINHFDRETGFSDLNIPLPVSPPSQ